MLLRVYNAYILEVIIIILNFLCLFFTDDIKKLQQVWDLKLERISTADIKF